MSPYDELLDEFWALALMGLAAMANAKSPAELQRWKSCLMGKQGLVTVTRKLVGTALREEP